MEQEPILNEHNKQEEPRMHTGGMDISLILKRTVIYTLLFVITLSTVAQERMYPIPQATLKECKFDKELPLGFGIDTAYKFVYLVEPSFTTEYCLTYDSINKSFLLCKSKSKIGYSRWNEESKKERKKEKINILSTSC